MMMNVEQIIDRAEERCKARGTRFTPKRRQVLSGLVESNKALSAYELIEVCKTDSGEELPPMSMYRILDFLREEHFVHKLELNNKYVACAHIACYHDHAASQFLICRECQSVEEIVLADSTMTELTGSIEQAGFYLESPKLEINCVCARCASA